MKTIFSQTLRWGLVLALICFSGLIVAAQNKDKEKYKVREFCSENWSNDEKVSFREIRDMTLKSTGSLSVDAGRNGGIKVKGENRPDVLIRACVTTWGATAEAAKSLAGTIRIATDSTIRTEGASEEKDWSVSYEILVPTATNLNLSAFNGGISIQSVDGAIEFKTTNGGVSLHEVAGDVKGKTTNGGISVTLAGNTWKGNGLDVETTNGGVHLVMPANYSAHFETRTVNGGFATDIPGLDEDRDEKERRQGVSINKDINGGGALIRVVTTNGGVKLSTPSLSKY
jgi:hypothetical protein